MKGTAPRIVVYSVFLGIFASVWSLAPGPRLGESAPQPKRDGEAIVIPVAAHVSGANNTFFVTDVRLFNPGADAVTADLYLSSPDTASRMHVPRVIGGGEVLHLPDVLSETFGLVSAVGAIEVRPSGGALLVTSRTYNTSPSGTYGQFIAGMPISQAEGQGSILHLLHVSKSSRFRSNVGFCELSGKDTVISVRMYDEQGVQLASKNYFLVGYAFHQINDIFADLGVAARANVRLTLEVMSGQGKILGYGSVVDNRSSDQIFVPAQTAPIVDGPVFVAAGASAAGAQNSQWRTDLRIANLATSERAVRISLLPNDQDNGNPTSVTYNLAAGELLALDDVLQGAFAYSGVGALKIDTNPAGQGDLVATSRTYNESVDGTFGQFIPALSRAHTLSMGEGCSTALQIDGSSAFRTNVGFLNTTSTAGTVTLDLRSESGTILASRDYQLHPYSPSQINDVFSALGVAPQENARIDFTVDGGGAVLGYASVIDNASSDPICVIAERWPVAASEMPDLMPTTPSGWSGPIVISTVTGSHTDGSPVGGQPAYIDLAISNTGEAASSRFGVMLKVDGSTKKTWTVPSLPANATWTENDYSITLGQGSHTLQLIADSGVAVSEENESNNIASKTMVWAGGQNWPDLTPTTPSGWSGPIVISTATGSHTNSSPVGGQPAYVDVAIKNVGEIATGQFLVKLKVDGNSWKTWTVSDLAPNSTWTQDDYSITLSPGSHTLQLIADSEGAVVEDLESNNSASKTMTWRGQSLPDLTPTTPPGWSGPIVMSGTTGTHTTGGLSGNRAAYIDVAIKNIGGSSSGPFSVNLKVDGSSRKTWTVGSLAANSTWTQSDYRLTLGPGYHTLQVIADNGHQVTEENESNNIAQRSANWAGSSITYHGNKDSKIFHQPSCRWYNCNACTVIFYSREAAIRAGYRACLVCKP